MAKHKRGPWARWEVELPLPPASEAERPAWEDTLLEIFDRQQQIKGAASISLKASVHPDLDLIATISLLERLLRRSRVIPRETVISDLKLRMDRVIPEGSLILECHRTLPPSGRLAAEVRKATSKRLRAWVEERAAA